MRVLLLSTTDSQGGAAKATFRLAQGLRREGHACQMLVKQKFSEEPWVHPFASIPQAEDDAARVTKYYVHKNRTSVSKTHFSLPAPGYDLAEHPLVQQADVIHLHWVAGFLTPAGIRRLRKLGKPLVWTLHDQRPFTGGCHYSAGCRKYETHCNECPQLRSDAPGLVPAAFADSLAQIPPDIGIICVSQWMAECARRSAILGKSRIELIRYGLDTDIFKPGRAAARDKLKWRQDDFYFLFGADHLTEKRKGFQVLRGAVKRCLKNGSFRAAMAQGRVQFVFFGEIARSTDLGFPATSLGRVQSESALAEIYAACDAFILSSYEDNLPNTMLESMCCGTPVIASAVGGAAEVIKPRETGLLTPAGDEAALAAAMELANSDRALSQHMSENCARQAPAAFNLQRQAQACARFFAEETLRQKATPHAEAPKPESFGPIFAELAARTRKRRLGGLLGKLANRRRGKV